jgi:hypothetical protein
VAGSVDPGIDKAKILAEIGVVPLPPPPEAPVPPAPPPPVARPGAPPSGEARGAAELPAVPAPHPAVRRRRRLPSSALVSFRTEIAALFTGLVALVWLAVGLATFRAIPLLVGGLFLGAALAGGIERWLGKKA